MRMLGALALAMAAAGPVQEEYWPMKEGLAWTYDLGGGKAMVQRVVGSETLGGVQAYVVRQGAGHRHWVSVAKDGVRIHKTAAGEGAATVTYDPPLVLVKFPLAKGDAWTGAGKTGGRSIEYAFRAEGEEELDLPVGKTKAFKISFTMTEDRSTVEGAMWVAKGLGLVRQTTKSGSEESTFVLRRFGEPGRGDFCPLAKGMTWVYQTNYADHDITYEVAGTETIGGVECFEVQHRSDVRVLTREWLSKGEDGVTMRKVGRGATAIISIEKPFFKLKYPLKEGDVWTGEGKDAEDTVVKYRTEVVGEEEVEVPAGTFAAWKLKTSILTGERHSAVSQQWVAKDVGLVKSEMTVSGGADVTYELKRFTKP